MELAIRAKLERLQEEERIVYGDDSTENEDDNSDEAQKGEKQNKTKGKQKTGSTKFDREHLDLLASQRDKVCMSEVRSSLLQLKRTLYFVCFAF